MQTKTTIRTGTDHNIPELQKGEETMNMKKLLAIHREIIRENAQKEQEWKEVEHNET